MTAPKKAEIISAPCHPAAVANGTSHARRAKPADTPPTRQIMPSARSDRLQAERKPVIAKRLSGAPPSILRLNARGTRSMPTSAFRSRLE
jgi:hypothetical protein